MILRQLERNPIKSLLAALGIASACAILILGLFWQDSIDAVIDVEFGRAQRDDLTVSFREPASASAVYELASIPGVRYAEPSRQVPVRLRYEQRRYDTSIEGVPEGAVLRHVIGADLEPIRIPERGLVLSERLAALLGAGAGDEIVVEVREGTRQTRQVQVVGLAQQFLGLGAYMELEEANRLAGSGDAITGARLTIDWHREAEIMDALRDRPEVLSIAAAERAIDAFMETAGASMLTFTFILSLFAGVIAFGVIYSHARISLAERSRELATLRVLGFTRAEIAYILLGELAVLVLLAIPIGLLLGTAGAAGAAASLQTELYQFPAIIGRATLALAAVVVLVAALVSALIVARKLWRLELVEVLKTRE